MNIEPDNIWVGWLIAGAIVGLFVNFILPVVNGRILDIAVGMVGGFLGGLLPIVAGAVQATHIVNLSIILASVGAMVALGVLRWLGKGQKLWTPREE